MPFGGAATVLALLTAPLVTAWVGLAGLLAILAGAAFRSGALFPRSPFTLPFMLYVLGAGIGWVNAVRPTTATVRLFGLLAALAAFVVASQVVSSSRVARRCVELLLAFSLAASVIMLILVAPFVGVDRLPSGIGTALDLLEPLRKGVLDEDDILQRYRLRASGLATLCAFGIALALGPLLAGTGRRSRALAMLCIAFFATLLIVAGNRGAMLSTAVVVLLMGASRNRWLLGLALVIAATALMTISGVIRPGGGGHVDQLLGFVSGPATDPGSVIRRMEFWENALYLLADLRFTGVGLGIRSVQETYETYFIPVEPRFSHAHNIFVQSYLEQGLAGLAGLVGIVTVGVVIGWRALAGIRPGGARVLAVSSAGGALTLILAGFTEIVVMTSVGMTLLGLALGFLEAARRVDAAERAEASTPRPGVPRLTPVGAAATAMVLAATITWQTTPGAGAQPARQGQGWPLPPVRAETVQVLDDASRSIAFMGPWIVREDDAASERVHHLSAGPGAVARIRFVGGAVSMYYRSGPERSGLKVSLDGQDLPTLDQRGPAAQQRWRWAGLSPGEHTLELTSLAAGADVDGFTINEPDLLEDGDPRLRYSGTWLPTRDPQATGGSTRRSEEANASLRTDFDGTSLSVYFPRGPDRGILNVAIDGAPVESIDQYGPRTPRQRQDYTNLSPGTHVLTLTVSGLKHAAASGVLVELDALVVDERPGLTFSESPQLGVAATPVAAEPRRRPPPPRAQPLAAMGAEVYLNLGTISLIKATVGVDRSREERERLLTDAEGWLREALDRDPANLAISRNLAAVVAAASQTSRARRILGDAEEIADPADTRFHFQAGRVYREMGETDRAIAAWTRAAATPQMIQWGAALVRRGQWKNAVDVNLAAVRLAPSDPTPYRALATAVARQRGDEGALAQMRELTVTYPDMPWPYLEAGELAAKLNRLDEARTLYQQALALAPTDPAVRQRAGGR